MTRLSKLIGLFLASVCFSAHTTADDAENPFARDILILTDWFEGEFDNEEQLWFHGRSRSKDEKPVRLHTAHKRVSLPAFGDHVFYVEEYKDNDPSDIIRQRLVTFESDIENNAIRMQQGFFKNGKSLLGTHLNTDLIAGLVADDVVFLPECDVFIRRVTDQFEGRMKEKVCVFGNGDERRYSVHNITLSKGKFWRTDATYLVSDDSFFRGTPPGKPSELRKAQFYVCDFYFYGEDRRQEQVVKNLRIHSQGGIGDAVRTSDGQAFELLLREKEYPYYETRPDFIYYSLRKQGQRRSEAYGVADPASRTFGVNAGHVGAFCHLDGYSFRQSFEELEALQ